MKYSAKVPKRRVFYAYLKTTNGINGLTSQELKVLSEFMWFHLACLQKDAYSIPGMNLFNTELRKEVCANIGLTSQYLTNLLLTLKKKGMVKEEGRKALVLSKKIDDFVRSVHKTGKAIVTFELIMLEDAK